MNQSSIQRASWGFNQTPSTSNPNVHTQGIRPPEMPPNERAEKQAAAQQAVDILHEIATILVSRRPTPRTHTTLSSRLR